MRTIETTTTVTSDGKLTLQVTVGVPPGEHRVVVIIDEQVTNKEKRAPLRLSAYPVGLVSDSYTFRREDIYDDNGS